MRNRALNLIWTVMRGRRDFTVAEIAEESTCERSTVGKYVKKLREGGFVELVGARKNGTAEGDRYRVTCSDCIAPDLVSDEEDGAQEKMWRSMRIFRSFNVADIAMVCNLHENTVKRYTNKLKQAGYVSVHVSNKGGGKVGAYNTYRLARDTGARSPVILRDGRVFDCNKNEFYGGKYGRNDDSV